MEVTATGRKDPSGSFFIERLKVMKYWMTEREKIRVAREAGKPAPWSKDPIFQTARFCNVRRMDDKVSRWLMEIWYPSFDNAKPADKLAAVALGRLINWPDSLAKLIVPQLRAAAKGKMKWDKDQAKEIFERIKSLNGKVFTGAYIINASGYGPGTNKVDVVLNQVEEFYQSKGLVDTSSMACTHANLQVLKGIGSFIAGQMTADMRYLWPNPNKEEWADRHVWAALGPGSRRGIAWLEGWNGIEVLPDMRQEVFEERLSDMMVWCWKHVGKLCVDRQLEAHDFQNVLCETDKMFRLMNGTGRAKNKFAGAAPVTLNASKEPL